MSLYSQRGVSAQKEDVHAATRNLSKGLYPRAFCKIDPDLLGGDADWVNVMHADGAGTKSILAYLYWKETGDLSVWKGIAQDAIVMNLDDLICTGIYDRMLYSSSIDRNKNRIPAEVLTALIEGTQEFLDSMAHLGVNIAFLGGETADVGDVVRTVAVNGTMAARWRRDALITNERIAPGQVIVGLASHGKATYEFNYNSGIGSNGLTSARHDVLHKHYKTLPETFDDLLSEDVVYIGKQRLTDPINAGGELHTVGSLLLSPTRTFAPVVRAMLEAHFGDIYGLIHCSGGGQTKCLKYMPDNVRVVKDNLAAPPEIFRLIQQSSGADHREMYQVFNMGTRLEVYTNERAAVALIAIARRFGIDAQVIGRTEESVKKELVLQVSETEIRY
ncbi:MAG: phosphoribosylformylglycinamidine cyclo-ligase [Chitinophagaceae bacterium]|nr:MAG: phosphoribosylformylglycinamidine cyclo-ligase [Chitinophagaceae bacterium]